MDAQLRVDYRSRRYSGKLTLASQLTTREDADTLSRQTVSATGYRALSNRWFGVVLGSGAGERGTLPRVALCRRRRRRARRPAVQFVAVTGLFGLVYTHEKFASTDPQSSPELAVGVHWDWFTARTTTSTCR